MPSPRSGHPPPPDAAHDDPLENIYVFGHHGFVQTVPRPPCTWTRRPAAVVLVSADAQALELELSTGQVVTGRVIAVSSMVERRLLKTRQPLLSFNVQPIHDGFPAFRALPPPGALALRPEPFAPLQEDLAAAHQGTARAGEVARVFEAVIALVRAQLPVLGSPDARLAAVMAHLQDHPRASPAELGRTIDRTGDWVARRFSTDMGISLRDYTTWLKQRALLTTLFTDRSITELALDAGFVGASQFASAYQRWYGRTPSASRDPAKVRLFVTALPASPDPHSTEAGE